MIDAVRCNQSESERIKFYLDEHVNPAVASGLRRRGVDVLTTDIKMKT